MVSNNCLVLIEYLMTMFYFFTTASHSPNIYFITIVLLLATIKSLFIISPLHPDPIYFTNPIGIPNYLRV